MVNKPESRRVGKRGTDTKKGGTRALEKPVALTLKVDSSVYVRLSTLRATKRRTHQDILRKALEEYLDREGV